MVRACLMVTRLCQPRLSRVLTERSRTRTAAPHPRATPMSTERRCGCTAMDELVLLSRLQHGFEFRRERHNQARGTPDRKNPVAAPSVEPPSSQGRQVPAFVTMYPCIAAAGRRQKSRQIVLGGEIVALREDVLPSAFCSLGERVCGSHPI
jgi:hypothetical protein